MVVAVVLAVLMAASAYAQTTDFFELVKSGTPQQVQAAINKGEDVMAGTDIGETALIYAAHYDPNPEVIAALLNAGADAKVKDTDGKTAFDYANWNEKLDKLYGTDAYRQLQKAPQ
jgi:ankyrin repeat protein